MKRALIVLALTAASASLPATSVLADPPRHAHNNKHYKGTPPGHRGNPGRGHGGYDSRGRYVQPHRITRQSHIWRGRDGRYFCRRDNGTTGLVIGAGVGALAGHELSGNGDKTLGTILGGVLGGVLGREIDRGDLKCR